MEGVVDWSQFSLLVSSFISIRLERFISGTHGHDLFFFFGIDLAQSERLREDTRQCRFKLEVG